MRRKGFTLIELLFVVIIIGILATILYPQFEGFRIRARLKEVENTIQLIRAAEKYYSSKSGAWYCFDRTGTYYSYVFNAPDDTSDGYVDGSYANVEDELNINLPPGTVLSGYGTITYEGGPQWGTLNDFHIVVRIDNIGTPPGNWLYFWSEDDQQSYKNTGHPLSMYITADVDI